MPAIRDFSGRVVLITGSSGGIGAVTATEFSKSGAQVVITGRNAKNLSDVGKECLKVSPKGLKALEVVADVNHLLRRYGVAYSITDANILDKYDGVMATNLRSVVYLTHLAVEHLEKTKGNIINISSVAGLRPYAAMALYCMSKCALDMFTKCLALELGPKGIRVNVVNPGAVKTNFGPAMGMSQQQYDHLLEDRAKAYPVGRVGQSIDIANIILFLASDESSFVTGINVLADGGGLNAPVPANLFRQNK
ncbi:unnamed protein product [Oppiella nova]|uniref:Uncharacterized protein n=1 Tax=Oppiella nova TaxID=334625 RepID=A0A7R9QAR5_9ACAR|nr:unnamed protein product [Oppiella nova]CAG2161457.1 unnamed protein product [Oppiella nova]